MGTKGAFDNTAAGDANVPPYETAVPVAVAAVPPTACMAQVVFVVGMVVLLLGAPERATAAFALLPLLLLVPLLLLPGCGVCGWVLYLGGLPGLVKSMVLSLLLLL